MIRGLRRARSLIAGALIAALTIIATQAPVVAHEAAHWAAPAPAPAQEHHNGDAIHLHRHDVQHDHEVHLQEVLLAVAPARFLCQSEQHLLPSFGLPIVPAPLFTSRVPDPSWSVRGPPPPLALSFPPAYSTAPPAA